MSAPDKATFSSRTMYPYDASLVDAYARSKEQRDEPAREDFAPPSTIEDAVMVVARGQQGDLR